MLAVFMKVVWSIVEIKKLLPLERKVMNDVHMCIIGSFFFFFLGPAWVNEEITLEVCCSCFEVFHNRAHHRPLVELSFF